jgi:3D (Asp-Asp-Asp) domain-containing protein
MKNRLSLALLAAFLLNVSVPVQSAYAASLETQLADMAVKGAKINTQIDQVMQLKQAFENSKSEGMLQAIAAAAVTKIQKDNNLPLLGGTSVEDTVKQAAQQMVQQQLQEKVAAKIAPYQNVADTLGLLQQLKGKLNPQTQQTNNSLTGAPENYKKILNMTATAYAPGPADNGAWGDRTYVGTKVRKGVAAVDPRVIPMGSKLWVEGYGYAVAEDQGSAIKGNRIDLAYNDFKTASDYGIQNVKVYILK